jgi:hypothetical protein
MFIFSAGYEPALTPGMEVGSMGRAGLGRVHNRGPSRMPRQSRVLGLRRPDGGGGLSWCGEEARRLRMVRRWLL